MEKDQQALLLKGVGPRSVVRMYTPAEISKARGDAIQVPDFGVVQVGMETAINRLKATALLNQWDQRQLDSAMRELESGGDMREVRPVIRQQANQVCQIISASNGNQWEDVAFGDIIFINTFVSVSWNCFWRLAKRYTATEHILCGDGCDRYIRFPVDSDVRVINWQELHKSGASCAVLATLADIESGAPISFPV